MKESDNKKPLVFKPIKEDKKQILSDLKQQLKKIKEELGRLSVIQDELLNIQQIYAGEARY